MRRALVALLIAATALFAAGAIAERSAADTHAEPPAAHSEAAGGEAAEQEEVHAEEDERVLGVDLESTPLIVLAVLGGLGLAALAASRLGTVPGVLIAIAVIAFAWALLDARELLHQLDESRTGIATVALVVAVLHLAAAGVSARLARDDGAAPQTR